MFVGVGLFFGLGNPEREITLDHLRADLYITLALGNGPFSYFAVAHAWGAATILSGLACWAVYCSLSAWLGRRIAWYVHFVLWTVWCIAGLFAGVAAFGPY